MAIVVSSSMPLTEAFTHQVTLEVRDYELDSQGIVNNAQYLHYLEHARAKFCEAQHIDLFGFAERGLVFVLYKTELTFRRSLTHAMLFTVTTTCYQHSPTRLIFRQAIHDQQEIRYLDAASIVVCLDRSTGKSCDFTALLAEQGIIFTPDTTHHKKSSPT